MNLLRILLLAVSAIFGQTATPCRARDWNDIYIYEFSNITDFSQILSATANKRVTSLRINDSPRFVLKKEYFDVELKDVSAFAFVKSKLATFDPAPLQGLRLKSLYLTENHLTAIPPDMFTGLSQITHLALKSNRISFIHESAFRQLKKLVHLYINDNRLTVINPKWFEGKSGLQFLGLSDNLLTGVDELSFAGLRKLHELDVHRNNITAIHPKAFRTLGKLKSLHLAENKLERLDNKLFDGNALLSLNLTGNNLGNITNYPVNIPTLWMLYLGECNIHTIPDYYFKKMPNLLALNLQGNRLADIAPGVFDNITKIMELNLNNNLLTSLSVASFQQFLPILKAIPTAVEISALHILGDNSVWSITPKVKMTLNPWDCTTSDMSAVKRVCDKEQYFTFSEVFNCNFTTDGLIITE